MIDTSELARRALDAAGENALATITHERSTMLRFARSRPTQATSIDDVTVEVAALRDGHLGRASTNRIDDEALAECARAAVQAAEIAARSASGDCPGFPTPSPLGAHEGHDPETARLDPDIGGAALARAFATCATAGTEANGTWTAGEVDTAIASSTGMELRDRVTDCFLKVVAFGPGGRSGYATQTAVAAGDIDVTTVAERAAHKASGGEVAELEPGEYTVVMEPHAVRDLLWVLGECAFNGLAHAEGHGAFNDKLGTRVVSPAIDLSDSPRHPSTLPRGFDAEGTPKASLPLIQGGVAHNVVHDTRSAALAGGDAKSTGHALTAGGAASGPYPTNLVMAGGDADDEDELCAPVERGIYVTRLWYANIVREPETLFTAVTRDGTFLIEDGRVTRPLADMRITDSALGILSRVQALGARPVLSSDGEFYGRRFATGSVCPPLRAHGVRFSGSAARG